MGNDACLGEAMHVTVVRISVMKKLSGLKEKKKKRRPLT